MVKKPHCAMYRRSLALPSPQTTINNPKKSQPSSKSSKVKVNLKKNRKTLQKKDDWIFAELFEPWFKQAKRGLRKLEKLKKIHIGLNGKLNVTNLSIERGEELAWILFAWIGLERSIWLGNLQCIYQPDILLF
jgi:hypothetical protein